jgi:hypothetical protein
MVAIPEIVSIFRHCRLSGYFAPLRQRAKYIHKQTAHRLRASPSKVKF